jgi:hypothetical protein
LVISVGCLSLPTKIFCPTSRLSVNAFTSAILFSAKYKTRSYLYRSNRMAKKYQPSPVPWRTEKLYT